MKTLIVGAGALGGIIAARLIASGAPVSLATRDEGAAAAIRAEGLTATGISDVIRVQAPTVGPLGSLIAHAPFDLIVLATKAPDAIPVAPELLSILAPSGVLLPIQNGGVAQILRDTTGDKRVIGGLSNLGATMHRPGLYEQRNAGHVLMGELAGPPTDRIRTVREFLAAAIDTRITDNFAGCVWSKLLLNCSVTTLGAIVGSTMREYLELPGGGDAFCRLYRESLDVALAGGIRPAPMLVEPIPPPLSSGPDLARTWLDRLISHYGDLRPSMLQDFDRGRPTEIDFVNGYVVSVARSSAVPTPGNDLAVRIVREITEGRRSPSPANLTEFRRLEAPAREAPQHD